MPLTPNPYLTFPGSCAEAFAFYADCFRGQVVAMMPFEGTPMADHAQPGWRTKILHAQLAIGDRMLMGSDAPPERYQTPQGISVSLNLTDAAEAERIFAALAEGGTVSMPMQQTFWAVRFGMLVDRFAIPWMINCEGTT